MARKMMLGLDFELNELTCEYALVIVTANNAHMQNADFNKIPE
jgi:hypothetical protein